MPRRRTAYDRRQRLAALGDVARYGRPSDPAAISQERHNEIRAEAGHPDLARADNLRNQLNNEWGKDLSWAEWVALAIDEQKVAHTAPGHAQRPIGRKSVYQALHRVHAKLEGRPLTSSTYSEEANRLRASLPEAVRYVIPNVSQVIQVFGSFQDAVRRCGLEHALVERPREVGVAMPAAEAVALFVQVHGRWPVEETLREFARLSAFALPAKLALGAERPAAVELLQQRAVVPPAAPRRLTKQKIGEVEACPEDLVPALHRSTPTVDWTTEAAVDALARWLDMRAGDSAQLADYKRSISGASRDGSLPSVVELRGLGLSWRQAVARAEQVRVQRRRAAPTVPR